MYIEERFNVNALESTTDEIMIAFRSQVIDPVSKEKLQQLLDNFFEVCSLCDEMNIYEFEEGDKSMQDMKEWVRTNFGRKLE